MAIVELSSSDKLRNFVPFYIHPVEAIPGEPAETRNLRGAFNGLFAKSRNSRFDPVSDVALPVVSAEENPLSVADEPRLVTIAPNVLVRHFSALWIAVDSHCDKAANFLIEKEPIMRFLDADAKLFARPFNQLNEVRVPKVHMRHAT